MEVELINKQRKSDDTLINQEIRCKEMLVITNTGERLGVITREKALNEAYSRGLDLVLVSGDGNPAVAKMMDYSKFRYEQQKKQKEMKKNQKQIIIQEIRISPTIETHDFETKARNAKKMLEKGSKVKVSLRFYGRMIVHQDIGRDMIAKFVDKLADVSVVESAAKLDGKSLFTILAPKKD